MVLRNAEGNASIWVLGCPSWASSMCALLTNAECLAHATLITPKLLTHLF
jgi:hypothetical protein